MEKVFRLERFFFTPIYYVLPKTEYQMWLINKSFAGSFENSSLRFLAKNCHPYTEIFQRLYIREFVPSNAFPPCKRRENSERDPICLPPGRKSSWLKKI